MQSTIKLFDIRTKQKEKILELFKLQDFVPTMQLVDLHIYQYNARIKELREQGYAIISTKFHRKYGFVLENRGTFPMELSKTPVCDTL